MWSAENKLLTLKNIYRGGKRKTTETSLDINVPYQSPDGQTNLCWTSIVMAAHNYFYKEPENFENICKSFDDCNDTPQNLDDVLKKFHIRSSSLGNNLKEEETISNVKFALERGFPIVLKLEKKKEGSPPKDVHFIFIIGFRDTKSIQWLIKDPSGANIDGEDVENTVVAKSIATKYEQYFITNVVELAPTQPSDVVIVHEEPKNI